MTRARQLSLFASQPTSAADLNGNSELRHTFALFAAFLKKEGKSDHTIKAFTSDLQLLAEYSGAETPIGNYTNAMLDDFMRWLEFGRGVPCSRKSYARRVTTLKVFFKWLHGIEAIATDPARGVLQRSGPAPLAAVLSPEEVRDAVEFARTMKRSKDEYDTRPEMLFRLILDTGIKKSEAMTLTAASLDRSNPQQPLMLVKSKVRNVYKERRIELPADWLPLYDAYMAQYRPEDGLFDCTARNLEYILTDIGTGADIANKLSFEMLRWTCAVRDTRAGMEAEAVREKLGLSPISWHETGAKIRQLIAQQLEEES